MVKIESSYTLMMT